MKFYFLLTSLLPFISPFSLFPSISLASPSSWFPSLPLSCFIPFPPLCHVPQPVPFPFPLFISFVFLPSSSPSFLRASHFLLSTLL